MFVGASDQQVRGFLQKLFGDRKNLLRRFALAEDHLRDAVTQRPMMIELRVAEVFERQMPDPIQRSVDIHRSTTYFFEQTAQLILIHVSLSVAKGGGGA